MLARAAGTPASRDPLAVWAVLVMPPLKRKGLRDGM